MASTVEGGKEQNMIDLEDDKIWSLFTEFFRYHKGYTDWSDEEIWDSHNDDDIEEFKEWVKVALPFKNGWSES